MNGDLHTIRRYGNRKLYDTVSRRYVTLDELGALAAAGTEIEVVDQRTGEDLTSVTLAQILLEGLKQRAASIPRPLLVRLVRLSYGDNALHDWSPQHAAERVRHEAERIASELIARGRLSIEEALALRQEITTTLHGVLGDAQRGIESRLSGLFKPTPERREPPPPTPPKARAPRGRKKE